jgi:hypothetical protein
LLFFIKIGLATWSLKKLQQLCSTNSWAKSGTKEKLQKRILRKVKRLKPTSYEITKQTLVEKFQDRCKDGQHKTISKQYATGFNHLDRFNRKLMEIEYGHRFLSWQVCWIWNMIHVAVINSWTCYQTHTKTKSTIQEFIEELVKQISISDNSC